LGIRGWDDIDGGESGEDLHDGGDVSGDVDGAGCDGFNRDVGGDDYGAAAECGSGGEGGGECDDGSGTFGGDVFECGEFGCGWDDCVLQLGVWRWDDIDGGESGEDVFDGGLVFGEADGGGQWGACECGGDGDDHGSAGDQSCFCDEHCDGGKSEQRGKECNGDGDGEEFEGGGGERGDSDGDVVWGGVEDRDCEDQFERIGDLCIADVDVGGDVYVHGDWDHFERLVL
jgi:hypothetical protein